MVVHIPLTDAERGYPKPHYVKYEPLDEAPAAIYHSVEGTYRSDLEIVDPTDHPRDCIPIVHGKILLEDRV